MSFMLCHKSRLPEKIQLPCAGYVIVVGFRSIGLRLAAMQGRVDPSKFKSEVPLFASFEEMLLANGIEPPKRNQFNIRDYIDGGRRMEERIEEEHKVVEQKVVGQVFREGDYVTWTSQAAGRSKDKTGKIVEIVPPGQRAVSKLKDPGSPRKHVSYVVEVAGKTRAHTTKLYWPVVSKLRKL